jgi:hypothetical protein
MRATKSTNPVRRAISKAPRACRSNVQDRLHGTEPHPIAVSPKCRSGMAPNVTLSYETASFNRRSSSSATSRSSSGVACA